MIKIIKVIIVFNCLALIFFPASVLAQTNCSRTSIGFKPLIDNFPDYYYPNATHASKQRLGLYGDMQNTPPTSHYQKAMEAVGRIYPRNSTGGRDDANGKIGFAALGMSNTKYEFAHFKEYIAGQGMSPKVVLVNGAKEGQVASEWGQENAGGAPWSNMLSQVAAAGLTPAQIQAVWMKITNIGTLGTFPQYAEKFHRDMANTVKLLKIKYTNVQIVYLSSRIYAGYSTALLSPEPEAYEGGFAMRWLIQDQIAGGGTTGVNYTNAPVLVWGPYLWADGTTPNSQGLSWDCDDVVAKDGVHPADGAKEKITTKLLEYLKTSDFSRSWFTGVPGSPFPSPSSAPSVTPSGGAYAKGDVNHDGMVNVTDIKLAINNFSTSAGSLPNYFDPIGDIKINIFDAGWVIQDW